jgi:hypothetical protein
MVHRLHQRWNGQQVVLNVAWVNPMSANANLCKVTNALVLDEDFVNVHKHGGHTGTSVSM